MNLYAMLFYEFTKVGLLAISGGLSTLPFLYQIGKLHHWYSAKELGQMLAISTVTPGPIGINLASFIVFKTAGYLGAFCSAVGIMIPSFFIVLLVAKLLKNFCENYYVRKALYALKPASCGMVAAVAFKLSQHAVLKTESMVFVLGNIDFITLLTLLILIFLSFKLKKEPVFFLGLSAILGIAAYILNFIGKHLIFGL